MNPFEAPRRRALSESELMRALAELPTDPEGLEKAQVVLERQAKLREEDNLALNQWIQKMREIGTKEAAAAVNLALGLESAEEKVAVKDIDSSNESLFTRPVTALKSRKQRRESQRTLLSLASTFVAWSGFAGIYVSMTSYFSFSVTDAIAGLFAGLLLSGLAKFTLITHKYSALLRSAATFGAHGYKFFGAIAFIALTCWVALQFQKMEMPEGFQLTLATYFDFENRLLIPISLVLILGLIIGQAVSIRLAGVFLLPISVAIITGFAIFTYSSLSQVSFPPITYTGVASASLLAALLSLCVTVLLRPHTQANIAEISLGHSIAFVLTGLAIIGAIGSNYTLLWQYFAFLAGCFVLSIFLVVVFRALLPRILGRSLSLVLLLSTTLIFVVPNSAKIEPYIQGVLIGYFVVSTIDSSLRRQPLHIPSLGTSYGFYGGWSLTSSIVVLLTTASASPWLQTALEGLGLQTQPALNCFAVAIFASFSRFLVVRSQDKDVANVQTRNAGSINLLGL